MLLCLCCRMFVKGFNFLVNSFWVEIEEKIEQYIKSIFAPGDPVLFHKVSKMFVSEMYNYDISA